MFNRQQVANKRAEAGDESDVIRFSESIKMRVIVNAGEGEGRQDSIFSGITSLPTAGSNSFASHAILKITGGARNHEGGKEERLRIQE